MKRGRRAKADHRAGPAILADLTGEAEVAEAAARAEAADASVFRMKTTASLRGSPANRAGKATRSGWTVTARTAPAAFARRRNDDDIPEAPKRNETNGKAQDEGRKARTAEVRQDRGKGIRSFDRGTSRAADWSHSL